MYKKINTKTGAAMIDVTEEGVLTYKGIREFISARPDIKLTSICDGPGVYRAEIIANSLPGFPVQEIGEADTSTAAYELAIIKATREAFGIEALIPGEEIPETIILKVQAKEAISEETKKTDKIAPKKEEKPVEKPIESVPVEEPQPTQEDVKEEPVVPAVETTEYPKTEAEVDAITPATTIIDCAGATKTNPTTVERLVADNFGLARWIANTHVKATDSKKKSQADAIIAYCEEKGISLD